MTPDAADQLERGDVVRVSSGPFTSFNAMVEDVDEDRSFLKLEVTIYGRTVPVELECEQVERL